LSGGVVEDLPPEDSPQMEGNNSFGSPSFVVSSTSMEWNEKVKDTEVGKEEEQLSNPGKKDNGMVSIDHVSSSSQGKRSAHFSFLFGCLFPFCKMS